MESIISLDYQILSAIAEHMRSDLLTTIMRFLTRIADHGEIWIIVGVILVFHPKTRRYGFIVLATLAMGAFISELGIKFVVQRPRPFVQYSSLIPLIPPPSGFSFPSSHALTGFACATVLFVMKKSIGLCAYCLAALIGFSRLYLCVHFPSDVLVGSILGIIVGIIMVFCMKRLANTIHYYKLRR